MIALPDVETLMAGGLRDWLAGKTEERAKIRKQARRAKIGSLAGGFLALLILAALDANEEFSMFISGAIIAAGFGWAAHKRKTMVDSLKLEMNNSLAKHLDIEYLVAPSKGSEFDTACQFDLLPGHHESSFQDCWHGDIGGTDFLMYEVELTERRGSGKNRRTVTVFEGVLLRFKFARSFLSTTLVRRDSFKFSLFDDARTFGGIKFERLKMVHPQFEDTFDVYSNDQVEGRYLVHPSYCERLLALEQDFEGSDLAALFHGGDLIVAIKTPDMFESAELDPFWDEILLARTIRQFASMAKLIQLLNERPRG